MALDTPSCVEACQKDYRSRSRHSPRDVQGIEVPRSTQNRSGLLVQYRYNPYRLSAAIMARTNALLSLVGADHLRAALINKRVVAPSSTRSLLLAAPRVREPRGSKLS